jgi:hypothetical protein
MSISKETPVLEAAMGYAARGWPVFPCLDGGKAPATRHGYRDATTDPGRIVAWFGSHPERNVAIATGAPGPDVLDVDQHGPGRDGYRALAVLAGAGLTDGAAMLVRTPSGGLHAYFAGTGQRNRHLHRHHLDFLASGGYVLAPPSQIGGRPYQLLQAWPGQASLDWARVTRLLDPSPPARPARQASPAGRGGTGTDRLAAWLARQPPGNRNASLYWAANRALDADSGADLGPLAAAARAAGLGEREVAATLNSARLTPRRQAEPQHSPEAAT